MAASMCASYSLPGVAAVHYGRGALFRETEIEIGEPGIGGPPGGAVPCHAAGKFTSRPEIALHLLGRQLLSLRRIGEPMRQALGVGAVGSHLHGLQAAS